MKNVVFAFAAATLATSAVMFSPAAFAAQAKVTWSDLDLSTASGKSELDRRIDVAARKVCAGDANTGTRISSPAGRECRDQMKADIAAKVNKTERRGLGG